MPKIWAPLYAYLQKRLSAPNVGPDTGTENKQMETNLRKKQPGIDNAKFPEMEQELFAAFRERRREGRSCKPNWFKKKAVQIMRSTFPNQAEEFKGSNGWFVRFCNRFDLVPRMKTNKKKKSAAEKEPVIEHFHSSLRQFLATNNGSKVQCWPSANAICIWFQCHVRGRRGKRGLDQSIPDVDSLLPDIEDDVEITEADAPLNDDEEYVVLNT